jgi:hypothetical protein
MRQRGRPSAAGLEVIAGDFGKRPEPSEDMSPEEVEIWRRVTASEPLQFFETAATHEMLKAFCRHQATADKLTQVINQFAPAWLKNAEGVKRYNDLGKMRDRETRAATTQATKLRITNQSRMRSEAADASARQSKRGLKPWEA